MILRSARGRIVAALAIIGALGLLTACGGNGGENSTGSSASAAPNTFNPCTDITDTQLRDAGLNPATQQPLPPKGNQVIACSYRSADIIVTIATDSTSFETYRDSNAGRRIGIDINRRPAVIVRGTMRDSPCELALKNGPGIVTLASQINIAARQWGMDGCGGLTKIAGVIEPSLDKQ